MRTKQSFWVIALIIVIFSLFSPNLLRVEQGMKGTTYELGFPFPSFLLQHGLYGDDMVQVVWVCRIVPLGLALDILIWSAVLILLKRIWWRHEQHQDTAA